ncbi:MAG: SDR family oxidoreductase [Bacteroidaceae bacterium]|nr:SDR family oxidoreductase [Bacteroidaceae bacterium]MBR1427484.1 SDR family oxidoreductase [Prevotella sp.]
MSYNPFSLEGKTILVTGASSGIGRATAIECSRMGAKVVITGRNEQRLQETFGQLEGEGHQLVIADLAITEGIYTLISALEKLDGVLNNAGFTITKPIPFIKQELLEQVLQVNTIAPIMITKELIKKKLLVKGASLVFTSSLSGIGKVSVGNSMYASSKGAISAFVRGAARELADKGFRVNAVCPGMVDTGILDGGTISPELLEKDRLRYPLKRYGKPEDIAWAIIYLLSDASSWMTGVNLTIDGGITI